MIDDFVVFCEENNVVIRYTDTMGTMPRGFCYQHNGKYYVLLNAKHSFNQLRHTTVHEIVHIVEEHHQQPLENISLCEQETDELVRLTCKELGFVYI